MITLDLSILNQKGTPMFNSDIFANRPTAGVVGRIFISTDTYEFYRDTGSAWDLIGGSGIGTITGSGTTGTLSKFTSSSSIGDSIVTEGTSLINITGTNSRLAIGGTDDGSSQLQTYFDGNTRWKFVAASNNAGDDADITGYRSRGTNASKLAIQSGDSITNYSGRGYDGTNFVGGAGFDVFAAENYSVGANGSYLAIETTPIGSATPTYFHRFSADGGLHVGQNSDPTIGFTFQVTGNSNVLGFGAFQSTLTAANNNSSLAAYGVNTLSYAAGFSSNNIGALYGGVAGFNLQTFAGSATFAQANVASGGASVNSIDFSSAGSTITMTQSSGLRVMSGQQNLFQYQGTNSGTITHAAISQNTGFYRPSGASGTLTITNAYSHLINALDDYGAGFTFTNRWGIYQAGASDKNYFAANMLLGSVVDNGNRFQVTGNGYFSGNVGIGVTSPSYKQHILSNNFIGQFIQSTYVSSLKYYSSTLIGYQLAIDQAGEFGYVYDSVNPSASYTYLNTYGKPQGSQFQLTANGNLGLGVAPVASTLPYFDGGSNLIISGRGNSYINNNVVFDSSFKYIINGTAAQYNISGAEHRWLIAPSGTAGNAITFTQAMTLNASGNLLINTTSNVDAKLHIINDTSNYAAFFKANSLYSGSYRILRLYANSNNIFDIQSGDGLNLDISNPQNGYLRFYTNGSNIFEMTNNGNFLIGSTSNPGQKLYLNGSLRIDGQTSGSAGGSSGQHLIINCDGTTYKIALLNN